MILLPHFDISFMSSSLLFAMIVFYFTANSVYLVLLVAAVSSLWRQSRLRPMINLVNDSLPVFAPSVSILAPAYNEQETIVESVRSFLLLNYPSFEVVVINDGSKDETVARLIKAFSLELADVPHDRRLSQTEIVATYRSYLHPNLVLIDKANGGKADALNVGIEFASFDIFCAVDSDSLLESDALLRVAIPFVENPTETIAAGGTVRIVNGTTVRFGRVESVSLPRNWLVLMQIIEYTRSFLCGRIGWNVFNSTLVISGAFGLFSRRAVLAVGGYTPKSIGEDMELIMRLHRHFREKKEKYSIVFISDPVCWTEAPSNFKTLQKQRDRWQRGLADSLRGHWRLFMNPRYGFVGIMAIPYYVCVELCGPIVELFSISYIFWLYETNQLDIPLFKLFFIASLLYGAVLSIAALLIEELFFSKYNKIGQFATLFCMCLGEVFGYRQIAAFWRLLGLVKYFRGDHTWGEMKRSGFTKT